MESSLNLKFGFLVRFYQHNSHHFFIHFLARLIKFAALSLFKIIRFSRKEFDLEANFSPFQIRVRDIKIIQFQNKSQKKTFRQKEVTSAQMFNQTHLLKRFIM